MALLIDLIDKAIELLKQKEQNNREFFDLIIDPLYEEFEIVAASYFKMFALLPPPDPPGHYGVNGDFPNSKKLVEIRNGYLQSRIKISSLVEVYSNNIRDKKVCEFLESIQTFFYGQKYLAGNAGTEGQFCIDIVSGIKSPVVDKKYKDMVVKIELRKVLEKTNIRLQEAWSNTSKLHGLLKLKYKLPKGF